MDIAALIAWLTTALGGSYLLITWLVYGGLRQQRAKETNFPALLIFGHFLLAACGLAMWIGYLISEARILAWAALFTLVLIGLLGLTMFARWGAGYQIPPAAAPNTPDTMASAMPARTPTGGTHAGRTPAAATQARGAPAGKGGAARTARKEPESAAESHFPIAVVAGHGAFATATLVLVLLATLGVGGG